MQRLQQLCDRQRPSLNCFTRRGFAAQQAQRQHEHILRSHIVTFSHWTRDLGWTVQQIADVLNLSPRTLRQWQHDFRCAGMQVQLATFFKSLMRNMLWP